MLTSSLTPDRSRTLRLVRAVVVFGVAIPLLLLGAIFASVHALDVAFWIGVVWFIGAAVLGGVVLAGWRKWMEAASPGSELIRNPATDFEREKCAGSYQRISLPARLLFVLTGTVVIGWLLLSV